MFAKQNYKVIYVVASEPKSVKPIKITTKIKLIKLETNV